MTEAERGPDVETAARDGGGASGSPDTWTVLRMILWTADYLAAKGVDRARLEGEHLLAHALGLKRLDLYLQFDRPMTPEELDGFRPLVKRRARREPLQYIVGSQPFRELDLLVDERVLIPRPETEVLVEHVLEWARARAERVLEGGGEGERESVGEGEGEDCGLDALDLGTGTGAIALSLAVEGPFRRVVATDRSAAALEVAASNRAAAGLDERVDLREGADYEPLARDERFDVVVSNPPYVAEGERPGLEPEVLDWEPEGALFAGPDGLDVIRRIVAGAPARLRDGGLLALEIGAGQAGAVEGLLAGTEGWDRITVRADLAGRERVVLAERSAGRID